MYHHDKLILDFESVRRAKTLKELQLSLGLIPLQRMGEDEYGELYSKEYRGAANLFSNLVCTLKNSLQAQYQLEVSKTQLREASREGKELDFEATKAEILKQFKWAMHDSRLVNKYFKQLVALELDLVKKV